MEWFLNAVSQMEVGTILVIFIAFWIYDQFVISKRYERLEKNIGTRFNNLESNIETRFCKVEASIITLNQKFDNIEKRLYSIEAKISIIETVLMIKGILPGVSNTEIDKK